LDLPERNAGRLFGLVTTLAAIHVFGAPAGRVPDDRLPAGPYPKRRATRLRRWLPKDPHHGIPPPARPRRPRVTAEEKTAGGIIIPDTAKEKPQEARWSPSGPGTLNDKGELRALDVKAATASCSASVRTEVKLNNEELLIMKESDIMASSKAPRGQKAPEARRPKQKQGGTRHGSERRQVRRERPRADAARP
jgi:chaperonin GroES